MLLSPYFPTKLCYTFNNHNLSPQNWYELVYKTLSNLNTLAPEVQNKNYRRNMTILTGLEVFPAAVSLAGLLKKISCSCLPVKLWTPFLCVALIRP